MAIRDSPQNGYAMLTTTKKLTVIFFTGLCALSSAHATSVSLIVNNTTSAHYASVPAYVYPDFDQGVYASTLQGPTCNSGSDYQTCTVNSGANVNFTVNKYNDNQATIICLSKKSPSGSFDTCAPGDCEAKINFSATGPVATPLNSNCAGYTFPGHSVSETETNNIIKVK